MTFRRLVGRYRRFVEAVCPDLQDFRSQRRLTWATQTMNTEEANSYESSLTVYMNRQFVTTQ
jgi:hypothetical protein